MPHQCTDCGRTFADGSKEMLSGCPDCGGNKFQFRPDGVDEPDPDAEPPEPPEPAGDGVTRAVGSAATAVRDLVSPDPPEPGADSDLDSSSGTARNPASGADPDPDSPPAPDDAGTADAGDAAPDDVAPEDAAQASARTDVVPMDELPSATSGPADSENHPTPVLDDHSETAKHGDSPAAAERTREDRPDLADLREELNDQFESIRVLEPGQYELNLMELYDREEYIIALQEDGKYTIQVPERWKDG
jgi:predicted  nucleic acid-binding Zn-ribbon protein